LAEYDAGKGELKDVFSVPNADLKELVERMKDTTTANELEGLYELIRTEIKEVEAIGDSLSMKAHYEDLRQKAIAKQKSENEEIAKLKMGKSTFKSLFTTKKPEEVIDGMQKNVDAVS
jgi:glutamyl-tRNA reductase